MSTTIVEAPNGALMSFIERAAKDENFDVQKFETLLRVRRDEAHDHARRAFNAAMAACQSEMAPVLRNATNPGVRSKYAKLETIDQQMRPIYTRHGFSVRFGSAPPPQPGWMRITCTVAHESGYFEENYLDSPVTTTGSQGGRIAMTPVQAVGSVVTYLRRYLLGMVFNIVQADVVGDDDDGESMRAAAAEMPRAPRVVDPAVYDAQQLKSEAQRKMMDGFERGEARRRSEQAADEAPPLKPARTRGQFLDALSLALNDAKSAEETDRILCGEEVMRAKELFTNGLKERLDGLISRALAKWWSEPPDADALPEIVGEEHAGA